MTYVPFGESELVGTGTPGNEYDAAIAELPGGGYLVAWYADGVVIAQRYDSDGTVVGGQVVLGGIGDNEPFNMVATTLADGSVVVSWSEFRDLYSAADVKAQIIAPDGSLVGGTILVEGQPNGWQHNPSISALAGGGFVVAWQDATSDDGGIRARLFDSSGNAISLELGVNTNILGAQTSPAVAALPGGGFVVTWEDASGGGGDSSGSSIRAQLFAADGSAVGGEFLVNTATDLNQRDPTVAALGDGGFIVCWTDSSGTGGDSEGSAIRAQRYAADGMPVGGEFLVNSVTAGDQENVQVAALANGGFVVTWVHGDPSGDYDIAGQAYGADGSPDGGQFTVNADSNGNQFTPAVDGFEDGSFAVAWIDYGAGAAPGTSDIRLQMFEPSAVAEDDAFTTNEQSAITGDLFADNGSGADFEPGAIVAVNGDSGSVGTQIILASGALLTVNSDGSFAYDPNGAFEYTPTFASGAVNTPSADSFSYTIANGDTAIVVFTINGIDNDDTVIGSEDNDRLIGGAGGDSVFGLGGADYITGSFGDDMIFGDDGIDRAGWYQTNEALGGATVSLLLQGSPQDTGAQGWDTLFDIENLSGTPFADSLTGDDNDNWLWGSPATISVSWISTSNNDFLDGQGGNDLLVVGIGNHTVIGGDGTDTLRFTENGNPEPGITVNLNLQGGVQDTGAGNWTLTGIENVSGGISDDTLIGDGGANVLGGDLGDDVLNGEGGDDTLYGDGAIIVSAPGSGAIETFPDLVASFGGVSGNDMLEGGLGNDTLNGGGGSDTASYANAAGGVGVDLDSGSSWGADGDDTLVGIENAIGSAFDDELYGDGNANILDGLGGNDFMMGGAGDDSLLGGDGNDVMFGDYGENDLSVTGDDVLDGGAGNDVLRGGLGNDTLIGGSGDDLLRGNGGVDFYDGGSDTGAVSNNGFGDRVSFFDRRATQGVTADLRTGIIANDGHGNVETMVNIESLGGDTAFADTFYGTDGQNYLAGNQSDMLYGFGGDDAFQLFSAAAVVDGGDGVDTLRVFADANGLLLPDSNGDGLADFSGPATAGWTIDLSAGTTADGYGYSGAIAGIENIDGTSLGDTLIGDGNANILNGGGGDDTLAGRGADDTLDGGAGTDTASYANAAGGVTVDLYAGTATGADGNDTLTSIENVIGGAFNDLFFGTDSADGMWGGDGKDSLYGFGGNDALYGGVGDDFIRGGDGDDLIDGGDGWDRASFYQNNAALGGVTVDLRLQGSAQYVGTQGWDTLVNIEHVSGTPFADQLAGDDQNNLLWGGPATIAAGNVSATNDDVLDGQGGDDLLQVGIGNHTLIGGSGSDTVGFTENGAAEPNLTVSLAIAGAQATGAGSWTLSGIENLSGGLGNDALTGDDNANLLAGNLGNDTLIGGAGNDTLYGDGFVGTDNRPTGGSGPITTFSETTQYDPLAVSGNDMLEGGLGNDILDGGGGIDTASYANASGNVTVNLGLGTSSGADGNDSLANIENVVGSAFNDNLTGNGGSNVLNGLGGNDTMSGGSGDDTLYGGEGNDFLQGDFNETNITVTGNDILYGEGGNDNLRGGLGNDQLFGGDGNDLLRGNGGVDSFDGGADDGVGFNGIGDRVSFFEQRATQGAVADLRTGIISNDGFGNVETMVGIESLGAGTAYVDTFYGNENRNYLAADLGDFLYGFGGDDLIGIGAAAAVVDGGDGIDQLILFSGVTLLSPDTNGDGLAESVAAATAGWSVNLTAGTIVDGYGNVGAVTGIENVDGNVLNDTLVGDDNANVLNGGDGDDLIEGRGGNDTLDGGNGTDTASYANAAGSVTANLLSGTATGADGSDTLANFENLIGGSFNDTLVGDGNANTLAGGGGHDSLRGAGGNDALEGGDGNDGLTGGAGDDILDGGDGFDRANYNVGATAGVTVNLGLTGAQNTGQGYDTLLNVEHVVGTTFNDVLTGNALDNWLWGGSLGTGVTGNDTISGGDGNDLIEVGTGNHTLSGGNGTSDTLSFWAGGTDVTSTGVAFNLANSGAQNTRQGTTSANGFENLSGSRYGDSLTGDSNNNILAGNTGNDTLNGGVGADTLYGDGGFMTVTAGGLATGPIRLVADVTTEFGGVAGNDILNGGDGDDFLYGGGGNDMLKGDRGNDTLYGGTGNDTLVGGQGNDRYVIEANSGADTISGFVHVDNIVFAASSGVSSFSQLILTKVGNSTLITWGNGNSILVDMKSTEITASDFTFEAASMSMSMMAPPPGSADDFFG